MWTPKTKLQHVLLIGCSFLLSLLVAFITSWIAQATTIPDTEPINYRKVMIDVGVVAVSLLPYIGVSLGFPRFGKEAIATKINEIGTEEAETRLEVPATNVLNQVDMTKLASLILDENERRQSAYKQPPNYIPEQIG